MRHSRNSTGSPIWLAIAALLVPSAALTQTTTPFTATIQLDEYAFPPATNNTGIVVAGPGDSVAEEYNLLDDATGDELDADNGDLVDLVFTYTASPPADLTAPNRPDIRFRVSGAAGAQITGRTDYSLGAPNMNNPGSRHFYEIEVRFADHLDIDSLSLDFFSLNTSGIAWEFSTISFLDESGNVFSPLPDVDPYLDYEPGETGNIAMGHYFLALTSTVDGVGNDQTASGTSNPPADGPIILNEGDLGVGGATIGGFIWRTTLEDVRGTNNGTTNFTSSLREIMFSGTIISAGDEADLTISKEAMVNPDDTVVFALEVANTGPGDATAVVVTDELPECTTYTSDDCDGDAGPPFVWEIGDLANEASATCNITVDAAECSGEQTNTATVEGEQDDPTPDDNVDEAVFEIGGNGEDEADLTMTPTVTVKEDATVDVETEVTNDGPADATEVEVTVALPECATHVSDDCEGEAGPPFTWTIGDLGAGDSASCTMTAEGSECEGEQTITVEVTADQEDPNPDDNTVEAVFDIEVVPALPLLAAVLLILLLSAIASWALRRGRA